MRIGQHSKGYNDFQNEANKLETVTLHGTLFVYVRRAAHLGECSTGACPCSLWPAATLIRCFALAEPNILYQGCLFWFVAVSQAH